MSTREDLRKRLRLLLSDPNIPEGVARQIVEPLLDSMSQGGLLGNIDTQLLNLQRSHACVGPRVATGGQTKTLRLATLIPRRVLLSYLFDAPQLYEPKDLINELVEEIPGSDERLLRFVEPHLMNTLTRSSRTVWATVAAELDGLEATRVLQELGVSPDPYTSSFPEEWFAIEYDIDREFVHTPTVIEAGLFTPFVSKAPNEDRPRAWNWETMSWGASEFVHTSVAPIDVVRIRHVGMSPAGKHIDAREKHSRSLFTTLAPAYDKQIEEIVEVSLRQVCAQRDLEPFLSGHESLLTLTPRRFEQFLGVLYQRRGYDCSVTQGSCDGGFDVVAISNRDENKSLLIQAKYTRKAVGISVIRELIGARFLTRQEYGDYMLVVATTGSFSRAARRATEQNVTELQLRDYESLRGELNKYGTQGIVDVVDDVIRRRREALGGHRG